MVTKSNSQQTRIALRECIVASIDGIAYANALYEPKFRSIAFEEYNANRRRAMTEGLTFSSLHKECLPAYIDCLITSIKSITAANNDRQYNEALTGYDLAYDIANRAGVIPKQIVKSCGEELFNCLLSKLKELSLVTITGGHERRGECIADQYEDIRYRIFKAGIPALTIDARMKKLIKSKLK